MNREEFIKHQEDMINELFPPEHRREVAEYAQDMLADACKEMERWHGRNWKEKAQADYDRKTAFLAELAELLRKYDAKINFGFSMEERTCGVLFDIKDERIFYPFKVDEMDDDPAIIYQLPKTNYPLTPDNIFDYEKE